MKLKKSLLAGATAATLALAGTGVATAQDGSADLPSGSLTSLSSEEGSAEGSADLIGEGGISGSLDDLFGDDGILGSFAPGEGTTWVDGIKGITAVISLIVAAVGLAGIFG
ncbi:hypothetical protein AALF15_06130 [Corynebacteriaceae bacterium 7-707]